MKRDLYNAILELNNIHLYKHHGAELQTSQYTSFHKVPSIEDMAAAYPWE